MKEYLRVKQEKYDTRMYCNLVYSEGIGGEGPSTALKYHLILPTESNKRFPLLVYIGGGGFMSSKPERHLPELNFFAQHGFAVASIQYRTTDISVFPTQIEDVRTAIRYFRSHAEELRVDPDYIFVMGGSAGGYLAAMAALLADKPLYQGHEYRETSDQVAGAICLYGIYDLPRYLEYFKNYPDKSLPIRLFVPEFDEDSLRRASVTSYVTQQSVPFLLLHGTADLQVPCEQSAYFHDRMEEAGNSVVLYCLNYAKHASEEFGCRKIQRIELGFMEQILKKRKKQ